MNVCYSVVTLSTTNIMRDHSLLQLSQILQKKKRYVTTCLQIIMSIGPFT